MNVHRSIFLVNQKHHLEFRMFLSVGETRSWMNVSKFGKLFSFINPLFLALLA